MSSFIVSYESMATIADAIEKLYNMSYEYAGFSFGNRDAVEAIKEACGEFETESQKRDKDHINKKHLFCALYKLNWNTTNARYNGKIPMFMPEFPNQYESILTRLQYIGHESGFVIPDSYYQLIKTTQCYLYQCCEGKIPEKNNLYKAVNNFLNELKDFVIYNTLAYKKSKWS